MNRRKRNIVLVVEDEPILRMMAVDLVEDAGLEATEAASAAEAVAILETRTDIRIVFTDIAMPGSMDGMRLAVAVASDGRRSKSSSHLGDTTEPTSICRPAASFLPSPTTSTRSRHSFADGSLTRALKGRGRCQSSRSSA